MKTLSKTILRGTLVLPALLVCGSAARSQAAAPVSPVGTWDFYLTGAHGQKGIAFIKFDDDGTNRTFSGFQLLVGNPSSGSSSGSLVAQGRNAGGDQGRNGLT